MLLPQFFPMHWLNDGLDIAHIEIASDLGLGIVERDGSGTYQFLGMSNVRDSGEGFGNLLAQAISNLRSIQAGRVMTAQCYGGAEGMTYSETDNFGAARLTIESARSIIAEECGFDCWIGVPCRDIAYFWSSAQDDARRDENEREVRSVYEKDDYNLSPNPISFRRFTSLVNAALGA